MPTTTTHNPLQQIAEHIRDWHAGNVVVDEGRRLVRNIALSGLQSVNGYRYSEQALREAAPLYKNKPVFLDHARNTARPFERSTRDLVGSVVNPRFENGRLRGDIQTLDTEAGRTFIALAESKNPAVGMSHVVLARRNADGNIVEKIEQVVSVDAVMFPATSSTFHEQQQTPQETLPNSLEALQEMIDAALPHHVQQLDGLTVKDVRRIGLFPAHVVFEARTTAAETNRNHASDHECTRDGHHKNDSGGHHASNSAAGVEDVSETLHVTADNTRRGRIAWSVQNGNLVLGETVTPVTETASENATALDDWQTHTDRHSDHSAQQHIPGTGANTETEQDVRLLERRLESLSQQRDELRRQLDHLQTQQQYAARKQRAQELLRESQLPEVAVTQQWFERLIEAADDAARRELIADRIALVRQLRVHAPESHERHNGTACSGNDAAVIAAIRGHRRRSSFAGGSVPATS